MVYHRRLDTGGNMNANCIGVCCLCVNDPDYMSSDEFEEADEKELCRRLNDIDYEDHWDTIRRCI